MTSKKKDEQEDAPVLGTGAKGDPSNPEVGAPGYHLPQPEIVTPKKAKDEK